MGPFPPFMTYRCQKFFFVSRSRPPPSVLMPTDILDRFNGTFFPPKSVRGKSLFLARTRTGIFTGTLFRVGISSVGLVMGTFPTLPPSGDPLSERGVPRVLGLRYGVPFSAFVEITPLRRANGLNTTERAGWSPLLSYGYTRAATMLEVDSVASS